MFVLCVETKKMNIDKARVPKLYNMRSFSGENTNVSNMFGLNQSYSENIELEFQIYFSSLALMHKTAD